METESAVRRGPLLSGGDTRGDGKGGKRGILGRLRSSGKAPRVRMDGKSAEESNSDEEDAIDKLRKSMEKKNNKREKNKEKKRRGYVDKHGNHHGSKAAAIL